MTGSIHWMVLLAWLAGGDGPPKTVDVTAALKKLEGGTRSDKLAALGALRRAAVDNQLQQHKRNAIKLCAQVLQSRDDELAEAACDVFAWLDAAAVPKLVAALQTTESNTQARAARALASIASRHPAHVDRMEAALPHLAELLHGKPSSARHNAFYAVAALGRRAIPHMVNALNAEEYFQWVLMPGFVRQAENSIEPLCVALRQGQVTTRRNAGFVLFHISWRARQALPVLESKALRPLMEAIQDEDQRVRGWAIETLGRLEGRARPALDSIIDALLRPDAPLRSIADAVSRIGPEVKHLDALFDGAEQLGNTTSPDERERAARAFGRAIGAVGEKGVKRIVQALDERRETVRQTAMYALLELGPKAAPAVPVLIRQLNRGDWLAPQVLRAIGPQGKEVVPHLLRHPKPLPHLP